MYNMHVHVIPVTTNNNTRRRGYGRDAPVPHFHSLPLAHVCRWFLYIFFVEPKSAAPAADRAKRTTADEEAVAGRGFTGEPWGGGRSAADGLRKFNGGKIIIHIHTICAMVYYAYTVRSSLRPTVVNIS